MATELQSFQLIHCIVERENIIDPGDTELLRHQLELLSKQDQITIVAAFNEGPGVLAIPAWVLDCDEERHSGAQVLTSNASAAVKSQKDQSTS